MSLAAEARSEPVDDDEDGVPADACGTGLPGVCASGTMQCTDGVTLCIPNAEPGDEACDGLDNDCDGAIDENVTPPAADNQLGICEGSVKICQGVDICCDDSTTSNAFALFCRWKLH